MRSAVVRTGLECFMKCSKIGGPCGRDEFPNLFPAREGKRFNKALHDQFRRLHHRDQNASDSLKHVEGSPKCVDLRIVRKTIADRRGRQFHLGYSEGKIHWLITVAD